MTTDVFNVGTETCYMCSSFPDRFICVNCTCKKRQDLMIRGCEQAKYNLPPCETGCCFTTERLREAPGS